MDTPNSPNTIIDKCNHAILILGAIIAAILYCSITTIVGAIFLSGLAIIPANIAKNKGYSFSKWWCYGFMMFIVAFIHALFLKKIKIEKVAELTTSSSPDSLMKKCPYCAEPIRAEAKLCRYCHSDLTKAIEQNQSIQQNQDASSLDAVLMVAEDITNLMVLAEMSETVSATMDLADSAASTLDVADSVVQMAEAIDVVSSAVEAADIFSSFGDFLDLFRE
ncbi:hypothetical protein VB712_20155 [Spirulina sp. CCNP1310]|uniref:hypothetical protein n=1 Tax=Spirulina sp. CCNP1310 TaxID=3110249 RepID=UPI002B21DBB9|nr:hypothetical protein [Spirulina sp. CCNP1310]MEA5421542.1 hypothetical protein [Spirulina sp. CCNP1310]